MPPRSKTIVLSHGSTGVGTSEIFLANFFLNHGYDVTIIDHFLPFGIDHLSWGDGAFEDYHPDVTLSDLLDTFFDVTWSHSVHIGMSLGGYLGVARAELFSKIYALYPGFLPLPKEGLFEQLHKIRLFVPEYDNWCKIPEPFISQLHPAQIQLMKGAYHSFMSIDKNKIARVFSYEFEKPFVPKSDLKNYNLSHKCLSAHAKCEKLDVPLRSDPHISKLVLDLILKDLQ